MCYTTSDIHEVLPFDYKLCLFDFQVVYVQNFSEWLCVDKHKAERFFPNRKFYVGRDPTFQGPDRFQKSLGKQDYLTLNYTDWHTIYIFLALNQDDNF